ncbi:MAG: 50S ribosomal protein L9 [Acholeplasmataceae bacterium]|nr:50S ribosomal protein L9 [Acholeplasmataceae bacterium]
MKRFFTLAISLIVLVMVVIYGVMNNYFSSVADTFYYIVLVVSGVVTVMILFLAINHQRSIKIKSLENRLTAWSSLSYHVNKIGDESFNELPIGIILYESDDYTVKWHNPFSSKIFDNQKIENKALFELHPSFVDLISSNDTNMTLQIGSNKFDAINNKQNQVLYLFDVTERENIKEKYISRSSALGLLYLDNFEEALQSFDVYEKSNIRGEYLGLISDWVSNHKGYLKLYTEDRMVIGFYYEELQRIIQEKFDILNKIREVSDKHRIRVTASIGIASWEVSYEELGILAQNAIELAEKRGGDQAVVNIQGEKIAYFGGKTNASEKSSRVQVRVQTQAFKDLVEASKNVLTIAHKQSDIDAFGAMIGVYRMAMASKVPCKIICDDNQIDDTVKKVFLDLKNESKEIFKNIIDTKEALKLISDETLLVVVDTQSPSIISSPTVLEAAKKIAIIDHHRHGENTFEGDFVYIEPYASSSVELIAEMMEFYPYEVELEPIEASIMYGGILVDTNEFTYRTGTRTFGAAAYLKEQQASSVKVKEWLRLDKERTLLINNLLNKVESPIIGFGIVKDDSGDIQDRVLLAQVSERILDIDGIKAGFTMARVAENIIGVSARSYDDVNVQIIMEEMNGGGHLNSAATQLENKTVDEVYDQLKSILIRESDEGGEPMKIILLEDVKSKGSKDDIISVPNGYGQYLLSNNKAILATPEAIKKLEDEKAAKIEQEKQHIQLMKKLKDEIESKSVTIFINIGHDGKLFGSVTTKQIAEAFAEQNGIEFDKKKVELTSEINSIGIYTATVSLSKDIKAQFEINVLEK